MKAIVGHVRGNAIAYLALFLALGGTSYAIGTNTIGSAQIRKGAVHNSDLGSNSVTSSKVKNGSLLAADFKSSELSSLKGATGATGPQGPKGDKGDTGATGPAGPTAAAFAYADGTGASLSTSGFAGIFALSTDQSTVNPPKATTGLLVMPVAGKVLATGMVNILDNVNPPANRDNSCKFQIAPQGGAFSDLGTRSRFTTTGTSGGTIDHAIPVVGQGNVAAGTYDIQIACSTTGNNILWGRATMNVIGVAG